MKKAQTTQTNTMIKMSEPITQAKQQLSNHFINVKLQQITAKKHIYNDFDYEVIDEFYEKLDEYGVPLVYNFLYKYILALPKQRRAITLSPDPIVSTATIVGLAEKFMHIESIKNNGKDCAHYVSDLKVIYFTALPHLCETASDVSFHELSRMIVANAICSVEQTITGHKLALSPDQFILIGLNLNIMSDTDKEELVNSKIMHFTLQQIRKKKIKNIISTINSMIGDNPLHLVFDMACVSLETAPCVTRFVDFTQHKNIDGFNMIEVEEILTKLNKTNLVGLDITGYDLRIERSERAFRVTCEVPRRVLKIVLNISEKKINIFNEDSKFLIWRPFEKMADEDDGISWFILRNVSLDIREQLIDQIGNDNIITFQTEDDDGNLIDAYISTTTVNEQHQKSYFADHTINDCVLLPAQKMYAMFELLNTTENSVIVDKA